MISLELLSNGRLVACVLYESGKSRNVNIGKLFDNPEETLRLLTPIVDAANSLAVETQRQRMKGMATLARCFRNEKIRVLPDSEDKWQNALNLSYSQYLLRDDSKATLETRTTIWSKSVVQPLKDIQERGLVIPIGVQFPERKKIPPSGWNTDNTTITGAGRALPVRAPLQKILIDIGFGIPNAAYLETCRDDLIRAVALLNDGVLMWWETIEAAYDYGQRVMREYARHEGLDSDIERFKRGEMGSKRAFIGGRNERSLGRLLCYAQRHEDGFSLTALQEKEDSLMVGPGELEIPDGAPKHPRLGLSPLTYLNWMLGRLGPIDIAMALALLQGRLPKFSPMKLGDACIRSERGKDLLEISDAGTVFRLEKPRIHGIKSELLDKESAYVIRTILRITEVGRAIMFEARAPGANRLFIVHEKGQYQCCPYESATYHLTKKQTVWLLDFLPKLKESGLVKGSLALRKIKASECVIEWFRTGSVLLASQKIGNSTRIAVKHYIPEPLLNAWNVRQIRRFQNLYICMAAASKPFVLEATDFKSMDDLHRFVTEMLEQHEQSSSHFAAELHKRFQNLPAAVPEQEEADSLMIGVDAETLSYLYLYRDSVYASGLDPLQMDQVDESSGLSPRTLIDLADVLHAHLTEHADPAMKAAHQQALQRVQTLGEVISFRDVRFFRTDA
ncbi:hypothetical protein CIC12_12885 [Burkholderia sp. SG-MS1]|uniref:hypothetical protein n=1 Tax=Paraburkholderia sp. SG-MS1 TaxID=2023741 RepID=UPI001446BBD6|nr:hypothetical protein [Paraburkholderia sp. SG-MS1]NKJ47621.1 hypothetical protein [Paraburkholderia sp. SG-MS1]